MDDQQYWGNDAFCTLPWVGVYIEPTGRVDNCCISHNRLGDINQSTLGSILTGDQNRQVRASMIQQQQVSGCSKCYREPTEHSLRHAHLRYNSHLPRQVFQNPNGFELRYADLRLRNTCNFACVYCSPSLSSQWAQELGTYALLESDSITQSLDFFFENAHTLQSVYMAGGEPLLVKENELILQHLTVVNPECKILVNTNLSNTKNNRVFELLLKFKNVHWMISAEDMDARFEYIRYHGVWPQFRDNLVHLMSQVPVDRITFNMVYFAYNARTIFDFIEWLESLGFSRYHDGHFDISWITHGPQMDPRHLPEHYKQRVVKSLQRFRTGTENRFEDKLKLIEARMLEPFEHQPNQILYGLEQFDKRRKLDSRLIFDELYQALLDI